MLKIEHISKTFNPGTVNEKQAIRDLSLNLEKGDFATIIGSNGAGKSTLFNAICGDFLTDSGMIMLDGQDITFMPQHVRAKTIGRLYQDPMRGTAPGMTIEENLALAAGKGGWLSHVSRQEKERFYEASGYRIGKENDSAGRTSLRWTETGSDTSHGNHESAQASTFG